MAAAGFIDRIIHLIRLYAGEAEVEASFPDNDLIDLIETAFQSLISDLNSVDDAPVVVRHNITLGSTDYLLPPSVEQILRIAKLYDDRRPEYWLCPRSDLHWRGPGFRLEGRVLHFEPDWTENTDQVEILYIPNGDFRIHSGTAGTVTSTTVVLAASPTQGTLDTRENAYVGAVLRITSDSNGYVQERTITAYDHTTRTATVTPAFSPTPSGTITYEVVPSYSRLLESVAALCVAEQVLAALGNGPKTVMIERQHAKAKRALLVQLARRQNITGSHMTADTIFQELN